MKHFAECRAVLEPGIAALAATRARKHEMDRIEGALVRVDDSMKHCEAFINADVEFHRLIAEATQNRILVSLVASVMNSMWAQAVRVFTVREMREREQYQHKRIFRALLQGDAEASRREMLIHLERLRDT